MIPQILEEQSNDCGCYFDFTMIPSFSYQSHKSKFEQEQEQEQQQQQQQRIIIILFFDYHEPCLTKL